MGSSNKMIFGYWTIHGLGSPIRLLLELVNAEYDEELYTFENKDEWFVNKKESLNLTYPNLPFLIDGEFRLTEHLAIMRYLGKKYNLFPETLQETVLNDQTESFCFDLRFRIYKPIYDTVTYETTRAEYLELARKRLPYLDTVLSKSQYVLGERMTYIDITVYDLLMLMKAFEPSLISENSNLDRFVKMMNIKPNIRKCITSEKWMSFNFVAPFAKFNGKMLLDDD